MNLTLGKDSRARSTTEEMGLRQMLYGRTLGLMERWISLSLSASLELCTNPSSSAISVESQFPR